MASGGPTVTLTFAGDSSRLGQTFDEVGDKAGTMADTIDNHIGKITAAGVALGGAFEGFARSQADSNAALRRTAVQTEETEDSLRSMISEMADGTTSAPELAGSLDRLTEAGVDNRASMEAILPAMSEFSTATGTDLPKSIDIFDRALSALDIPLEDVNEHLDTMTFLSEQTTVPMGNFAQLMRREAPAMKEMGLSLDDVAVAMSALEEEGIRGPRAVMGFQDAIKEADGSVEAFWENLNVSNETLETQREQLAGAAGLTEDIAAANESAITPMQRLSQWTENLMFEYGGLADAAGMLAIPLLALGPIAKGVSFFFGLMGKTALINGAKMAAGWLIGMWPIALVIIGIGLLVAAFLWLWNNVEGFRNFFLDAWEWIKNSASDAADWVRNTWNSAVAFFRSMPTIISAIFRRMGDGIRNAFRSAFNFVANAWNNTIGSLSWTVPSWIPGIGGSSLSVPNLPTYHQGGTVAGRPGQDVLAILQAGERVTPASEVRAESRGGAGVVEFVGDVDSAFATAFMKLVRTGRIQVRAA